MNAPFDKNDVYRYELMMPLKKWACYSVPMKAAEPGYDVIMASGMLGHIAQLK